MTDVTDRVRAERALQASETRMRALFAVNDVIIVLDKDGRYIEIAPTRGDLLYRPREELLSRTVRELFDSDLADRFLENIHKALTSQSTVDMDYSLAIRQSHLWFEARISPLPDERVLLVAHDATARHDAQEAARIEASKAETYFNTSGVIMEVTDTDLRLVRLNQRGYDFFGYTPDEIVGKDWFDIKLPERERDRVKTQIRRELAEIELPPSTEGPVVTRSGEERIVAWHDSLLRDADGRVTGLISSGVDVTHRVRPQSELQRMDKLESLGTLAGGIAHDFNNMLTGIIGNINLARIEDDPGRSRELLQEAEQEILQARGLSQQLLTFAKGARPSVPSRMWLKSCRKRSASPCAVLTFRLVSTCLRTCGGQVSIRGSCLRSSPTSSSTLTRRCLPEERFPPRHATSPSLIRYHIPTLRPATMSALTSATPARGLPRATFARSSIPSSVQSAAAAASVWRRPMPLSTSTTDTSTWPQGRGLARPSPSSCRLPLSIHPVSCPTRLPASADTAAS
jgi:PAS domain S-box-containing protein